VDKLRKWLAVVWLRWRLKKLLLRRVDNMQSNMEQMYQEALNPQLYPDARLLAVLQGHDTSLPMSVAMAAKQQRDQLETAFQGQQAMQQAKQPSVRDQMAQQGQQQMVAQQQPQNLMMQEGQEGQAGLDQLPANNLKSMAGGGIVAFASGGNALSSTWDDDEDPQAQADAQEDSYLKQMLSRAGTGIQHFGSQVMDTLGLPHGQQAAQTQATGVKGIMDSALQKYNNVPPQLAQHVLQKETGGMQDPANAVSKAGAIGHMQIMPKTAQSLGITNPFDPEQNIYGGIKYLSQLMTKYKDPKLAAMAYNWGPGNVDKWMKQGQKANAVPKETRNYVADAVFAEGGEVAHFDTGGQANTNNEDASGIFDLLGGVVNKIGKFARGTVNALDPNATLPVAPPQAPANTPNVNTLTNTAMPGQQFQLPANPTAQGANQTQPAPVPNAPAPTSLDEYYNKSQARIDESLEDLRKQRKEASGLGLLTAGLGMLGKSPFAGENIKEGALAGISQYGQDVKGIGALQNQVLGAQAALDKNRAYAAIQHQGQEEKGAALKNLQQQQLQQEYDQSLQKYVATLKGGIYDTMTPEQKMEAAKKLYATQFKGNEMLQQRWRQAGLDPSTIGAAASNYTNTLPAGAVIR
jgi:hypothetical protein